MAARNQTARPPAPTMRVGAISRKVGISSRRIIEYERLGLLKPQRHPRTGDRLFTDFEVRQVARIKHLISKCGFTLASLRYIGMMVPCWKLFGCASCRRCPAFRQPHRPCWTVAGSNKFCTNNCPRCIVYLTSHRKKPAPLFSRPLY